VKAVHSFAMIYLLSLGICLANEPQNSSLSSIEELAKSWESGRPIASGRPLCNGLIHRPVSDGSEIIKKAKASNVPNMPLLLNEGVPFEYFRLKNWHVVSVMPVEAEPGMTIIKETDGIFRPVGSWGETEQNYRAFQKKMLALDHDMPPTLISCLFWWQYSEEWDVAYRDQQRLSK
jgi:hypothetical protein